MSTIAAGTTSGAALATALRFLAAYETLDTVLFESVMKPGSDSFIQTVAPSTLTSIAGSRTRAGFLADITRLRQVLDGFPVSVRELLTETNDRVVLWCTSEMRFKLAVTGDHDFKGQKSQSDGEEQLDKWNYQGEYVFAFEMVENGTKVRRVVDFMDSAATIRGEELLQAAAKLVG